MHRAGEQFKQKQLVSLRSYLEYLKIQADINDPAVKRKFEDGLGKLQFREATALLHERDERLMCAFQRT